MADKSEYFLIGHILLTLGILGYVTDNTYLAYICLPLAIVFFARQLLHHHINRKMESVKTVKVEEDLSASIQTVSKQQSISSNQGGNSL